MGKPEIIAIAALGKRTRNICREEKLLWHISEDLKRVKEITLGFPIIMGRKTYQSIGKPLPGRTNIILTRDRSFAADDCKVANSLDDALEIAQASDGGDKQIFTSGGAEIYSLALQKTDKLLLTLVDSDKEGTAQFPEYKDDFVETIKHGGGTYFDPETDENAPYEWVDFERKK